MNARSIAFSILCAWMTAAMSASLRAQDSANELSVAVGKTVLVDTAQPVARVSVGLGDIAIATAVSPTEIMVNGKAPGETSLILWDVKGGRQFFNVSVHANDVRLNEALEGLRRELRLELPQQSVRVSMEGGNVFLRGTVNDLTGSERAVRIAATAGKVVNLLDVRVPESKPQILLKVRFASVDRQLETQLGINFFDLGLGNAVGGITTGQFSPPAVAGAGAVPSGSQGVGNAAGSASFVNELNLLGFFPGLKSGADLQALDTQGLVQLLAEPNLLASDGKEASFLAGGEYPYPVVQGTSSGSAAVTIEFKDYGIRLNFIPTVTPRGTIRLQVAPEVSALDYSNEIQISGFTVPGITTRNVNTEVELKNGQSFVIGGLLDNSITQTFEKIPFLGDIPVLGKFFQSIQKTKNNSELIVIVTPEIVPPIPAGAPLPQLNYPVPFMPTNSKVSMHTPDSAAVAQPPSPPAIPVEKLIDSEKAEQPLVIPGSSSGFSGTGTSFGGATSGASAPQQ